MTNFLYINQENHSCVPLLYYVNRAGKSEVGANFDIKRSSAYPYCVIHFVLKGTGCILYRNKKFSVREGQFFILNAFEPHQYTANPKDPFILYWIEFAGGDCNRLVNAILEDQSPVLDLSFYKIADKYVKRIFLLLERDPKKNSFPISKTLYALLLSLLNIRKHEISYTVLPASTSCIHEVLSYIDKHLNEALAVEKLADIAKFDSTYFSKLFKKLVGVTPARYIFARRLTKAKDYLYRTDLQIEWIAEKLGFCNASHFIRSFKKAEGLTPAEYRRQSRFFN